MVLTPGTRPASQGGDIMPALLCYHVGVSRQLTIRNVPDEVGRRLDRLSHERGESLNSLVVSILADSVGVDARRARLERYVTWTDRDADGFDEHVAAQRVIDDAAWR